MVRHIQAILAYGHALGDNYGFGHDNKDVPAWMIHTLGPEIGAEQALRSAVGFTETDWRVEGYNDRLQAADERVGMELVIHGDLLGGDPNYILAATHTVADLGAPASITDLDPSDNSDRRLAWALKVLGITPVSLKPQWYLAALTG